jgi:pyruvate dehydrogenase E1 component alpha subunit
MCATEAPAATVDAEILQRLYRGMVRIRRAEERVLELLLKNKLSSTMCHVSIGQEAVAVGVCDVLGPEDYITSTHRGHGHFLARGGAMGALMAELMGRETGACRGRGSSMHLVDVSIGHLGSNAIVGGHIPIATGAALDRAERPTSCRRVVLRRRRDVRRHLSRVRELRGRAAVADRIRR